MKHKLESNSKSTSSHAKMLSPNVNIYEYPDVPSYHDLEKIILAYPSEVILISSFQLYIKDISFRMHFHVKN